MTPTDLLMPVLIILPGIVVAVLFFHQQISAIEGWTQNHLERPGLECTSTINE